MTKWGEITFHILVITPLIVAVCCVIVTATARVVVSVTSAPLRACPVEGQHGVAPGENRSGMHSRALGRSRRPRTRHVLREFLCSTTSSSVGSFEPGT